MILVTGSDGIVGRRLCKKLVESGVPFLPLTHRRKPHTLPGALLIDLVRDHKVIHSYTSKISAIVHLAAAVPHNTSYPDNNASADYTRCMDRNVYYLQQQTGAPIIYMSTCGLYDRLSADLKHEDSQSPLTITSPYFAAKAEGENLFLEGGKVSTILRLSAPVGLGLKPQLVLSRFIAAARTNGVIKVWGNGSREQDFIDTADVADLILSILSRPATLVVNAAAGAPITMAKLAETVIKVVGSGSIEKSSQPDPRDGETARYAIGRAREHFHWTPRRTLEQSIIDLLDEDFEVNAQ
jgi:nucleoside-diphosphate-sugar epimerase